MFLNSSVWQYFRLDLRVSFEPSYENMSSGICGQRRPRSACASAQSDQETSLSANKIIGYYTMYEWIAKAQMNLCACAG